MYSCKLGVFYLNVLFIDVKLSIKEFVPITNNIVLNTEANIVVVLHGYLETLFALRLCCFSFVFCAKKSKKTFSPIMITRVAQKKQCNI